MFVRPLLYLAAPYWHVEPDIRETRVLFATVAERKLINYGFAVLNPIRMSRDVADVLSELAWREHGISMLRRCDIVVALRLPGYMESKGVAAELALARKLGIPTAEVDNASDTDFWLRWRDQLQCDCIGRDRDLVCSCKKTCCWRGCEWSVNL